MSPFLVRASDCAVEIDETGVITHIHQHDFQRAVKGYTRLLDCRLETSHPPVQLPGGGVQFIKRLMHVHTGGVCTLTETFFPARDSIRWELEIVGEGDPWSTPIETCLVYSNADRARFWTAWSDPAGTSAVETALRQGDAANGNVPISLPGEHGDWNDPLEGRPFSDNVFYYGARYYEEENPNIALCPFNKDVFCIPLATVMEDEEDAGYSLICSPEDTMLDSVLSTDKHGTIVFSRLYHRISADNRIRFAMDLTAHEADWRGGLRWMAGRYPAYFYPANPRAADISGCGAYSMQSGDFDAEKLRDMGFRLNWKASFDFPYMGMFIPPVQEGEQWTDFKNSPNSLGQMRRDSETMRALGFHLLHYFNVTEFGAKVDYPFPAADHVQGDELWKDCNVYLKAKLEDAVLLAPQDAPNPVNPGFKVKKNLPYWSWEGAVAMDPGEPVYRHFLLEQAQKHVDLFPASSGICIDRMDWLRLYNDRRDDGVSWINGKKARSLYRSWHDLMERMGMLFHEADKVIYCNNHTKRIDLLRQIDGLFDEFTYAGTALNTTALLGIGKPVIGWATNDYIRLAPDAFIQKFIYMGVHPIVPFPGNDHSLQPDADIERYYLDYAPFMELMRGRCWVLTPHAIRVTEGIAKANLFETADGYLIPVMLGGSSAEAALTIRHPLGALTDWTWQAVHPGSSEPSAVTALEQEGGGVAVTVPLVRGCAMLQLKRAGGR
jgi:hypothetical protein